MVQPEEMAMAVVVTGIPIAEQTATEDAVVEAFSEFGDITRLILQTDDGGTNQHAVLIYSTAEAAAKAVDFSGKSLSLGDGEGSPVEVSLASTLSSAAGGSAAQDKVVSILAGGMVLGGKGVSSVKNFDEQHNISLRVQIAAEMAKAKAMEFDEKHGISTKASAVAASAKAKAAEIDEQYEISRRTTRAASAAQEMASTQYNKAMENEKVKESVTKAASMFKSMWAFGASKASAAATAMDETVKKAKEKAAAEEAEKKAAAVEAEAKAAPAPAAAAAASAGGAADGGADAAAAKEA
jgi:hypothetical protein